MPGWLTWKLPEQLTTTIEYILHCVTQAFFRSVSANFSRCVRTSFKLRVSRDIGLYPKIFNKKTEQLRSRRDRGSSRERTSMPLEKWMHGKSSFRLLEQGMRNSIGCSALYAHTRTCTKIAVSNNSSELCVCDVSTGKYASKFRPVSM